MNCFSRLLTVNIFRVTVFSAFFREIAFSRFFTRVHYLELTENVCSENKGETILEIILKLSLELEKYRRD